jgi:hypothetical protein
MHNYVNPNVKHPSFAPEVFLLQFDVIPGNVVNFYNIKAETE